MARSGWTALPGLTINRRSQALGPRGARVAQLVEHATENRSVGGSIPPLGTTFRRLATRGAATLTKTGARSPAEESLMFVEATMLTNSNASLMSLKLAGIGRHADR